jgi:phosphoribosylformylglycinamidine synthase
LEVPITGGNVSFYNETLGEGIYPTPVMGIVGVLEDVHKTAKMDFREAGHKILLLRANEPGDAVDAESEFGSSEYAKEILGAVWGYPPQLDLEREAALQKALITMIQKGLVESAHDCSSGGMAVALVEPAFAKGIGVKVDAASNGLPPEFALFGEDASRVVLACDPKHVLGIKELAVQYGLSIDELGETVPGNFEIRLDGQVVVSAPVADLRDVYESALEKALRTEELVASTE